MGKGARRIIFFRTFVPDMKKEIRKISGIWDIVKIINDIPEMKQLTEITFTLPNIPERNPEDNSPVISQKKDL